MIPDTVELVNKTAASKTSNCDDKNIEQSPELTTAAESEAMKNGKLTLAWRDMGIKTSNLTDHSTVCFGIYLDWC